MTIMFEKDRGRSEVRYHKRKTWINAKEMMCIWWYWKRSSIELLPPENDWFCQQLMRLKRFKRSGQNWSIERVLSFIMTTADYTYLWQLKNWESSDESFDAFIAMPYFDLA